MDLMGVLGDSDEHWQMQMRSHASGLAGAVCQGLLGRNPNLIDLSRIVGKLLFQSDSQLLIADIGKSSENWNDKFYFRSQELVEIAYLGISSGTLYSSGDSQYVQFRTAWSQF